MNDNIDYDTFFVIILLFILIWTPPNMVALLVMLLNLHELVNLVVILDKCEYLHSRIIKAANSTLPSVTVGNTYIPKKPKDLESLCQSYRFLSKL
ncbi:hypothetical protein RIR_jg30393.t1 [Rhizophagus irregularis DAOM 181602=DAOM 197198]|nr:hypothetical protein RIR_jg30393.t1 [Rhizophagus irregularis DAOM 181602=DAOM 197198]